MKGGSSRNVGRKKTTSEKTAIPHCERLSCKTLMRFMCSLAWATKATLQFLRKQDATSQPAPADHAAVSGNVVVVDMQGLHDGVPPSGCPLLGRKLQRTPGSDSHCRGTITKPFAQLDFGTETDSEDAMGGGKLRREDTSCTPPYHGPKDLGHLCRTKYEIAQKLLIPRRNSARNIGKMPRHVPENV